MLHATILALTLGAAGCGDESESDGGDDATDAATDAATDGGGDVTDGSGDATDGGGDATDGGGDATDGSDDASDSSDDASGDGDATDGTPDLIEAPEAIIDLRADVNRDGVVSLDDPDEDEGEAAWSATRGAIFLANIDDDQARCATTDAFNNPLPDLELGACNDASDEVINGESDRLDLAPLAVAPWPEAPDDASATVTVSFGGEQVRLFVEGEDGALVAAPDNTVELDAAALRGGATLALEGKDIARSAATWTGVVNVDLTVMGGTTADGQTIEGGADTVQLRVAPLMFNHHLQAPRELYVTYIHEPITGNMASWERTYYEADNESWAAFDAELRTATEGATEGAATSTSIDVLSQDRWMQDLIEIGWMAMPGADGAPHVIDVYVRSPNESREFYPDDPLFQDYPMRFGGRIVYDIFRGPDVAGLHVYDPAHPSQMDSLDSFGNMETIPPHTDPMSGVAYPNGRILMGNIASYYPSKKFTTMLETQGAQKPLWVDTSWLAVGHVDEFISFVQADTERGWGALLNDPLMAINRLEQLESNNQGRSVMFSGLSRFDFETNGPFELNAERTVSEVLADPDIMASTMAAAAEVEAQFDLISAATGLELSETVPMPFLHEEWYDASIAYGPGTVNGVSLGDGHYAMPRPHGPMVAGTDRWQSYLTGALSAPPYEMTSHFVEDWYSFHLQAGEIHCGSNALREPWQGGRWWQEEGQ